MAIPGLRSREEIAADIWGITPDQICQKRERTRKREVVEARMTLMWHRNQRLNMSQAKAAEKYGLTHCATIHACKMVSSLIVSDKNFASRFERFCKMVS